MNNGTKIILALFIIYASYNSLVFLKRSIKTVTLLSDILNNIYDNHNRFYYDYNYDDIIDGDFKEV